MRRFRIDLNEWYKKDKNDGTDIGRTIGELTFEQKEGEQNTIRDLKNWLLLKGLEDNNDFCPCPQKYINILITIILKGMILLLNVLNIMMIHF